MYLLIAYISFIVSARIVGGWGFNPLPLWCLLTSQVCIYPEKIVKISQKYIAPPLVFPQIEY